MTLAPGTRLGPYEILAPLGAGGMGEVYRARDAKLKRDVAIKVLADALVRDPDALARFEREALAVAALSHPGILSIFDFATHDGVVFAVMELLEGGTLRERLDSGPIPVAKALLFAREIAEALDAAHVKGIVHRDLKPENLFVTREGHIKILDFGLARRTLLAEDESSAPTLKNTEPGTVLGTVGYMSPEQVRGTVADHRSDIFSLGVVLYELLSGRRAFRKGTGAETMAAILNEEPAEITNGDRDLPPMLDRIMRRCLEKDPAARFQSARDLAFALDAASDNTSTGRMKAVAPHPSAPPARRWKETLALMAVAGLAGILGTRALWKPPAPSLPSYRQLTFKKGTILSARFAPDGSSVVYSAAWDGNPTEIFTTSIDALGVKPVGIANASLFAVARNGDLAVSLRKGFFRSFSGSGMLARVAAGGGAPREILDDVLGADLTPDGKSFAVMRINGIAITIEMPIGKVIYGPSPDIAPWGDLRVSPDGRTIAAFERSPEGVSVVAIDLSGKKTTLTKPYGSLAGLAWTGNGREVWFAAVREGRRYLKAVNLSGGERLILSLPIGGALQDLSPDGRVLMDLFRGRTDLRVLVPGEDRERTLSGLGYSKAVDITRDGRSVLLTESGLATGSVTVMFLRATDGSPPVRLGEGVPYGLSPDGKLVIAAVGTPPRLALVPTGAGETLVLDQGGIERVRQAAFHPDGQGIFVFGAANGQKGRIWKIGRTEPPVPVSEEGVGFVGKAVSPDGKWIVAFRDQGSFFLLSLDGQPSRETIGDTSDNSLLSWSEDGKWLYVSPDSVVPGRIDRLDPLTGQRETLHERSPADSSVVVRVLGQAITPDGRGHVYGSTETIVSDLWLIEGLK